MTTKEELDILLDTTAINKRMADRAGNPYRWREGSFQVPKYASNEIKKQMAKTACDRFVDAFTKKGWTLKSKLQVIQGQPYAYDLDSNAVLLDKEEWRVRAIFAIEPKPMRIELPLTSIKQAPDHMATVSDVAKGEGIKGHNPRVRENDIPVAPIRRRVKRRTN